MKRFASGAHKTRRRFVFLSGSAKDGSAQEALEERAFSELKRDRYRKKALKNSGKYSTYLTGDDRVIVPDIEEARRVATPLILKVRQARLTTQRFAWAGEAPTFQAHTTEVPDTWACTIRVGEEDVARFSLEVERLPPPAQHPIARELMRSSWAQ